MHLNDPVHRFMFSWQLVGTCIPVAAGLAWAVKNFKRSDDIVAVFFGDAATANAQFHEGLNIAAVQRVPLLLICENNHLAGNVGPEHYQATGPVRVRALSYGIDAAWVDGNQVDQVVRAVTDAAEQVRRDSRPYFLECDTTRVGKHKQGQGDIRSKEELAELAKRDPLLYEERRLGINAELKERLYGIAREAVMQALEVTTLPAKAGSPLAATNYG
jgi:TPP-dependent pyruvate/acetoin dehydrogenase alpha subunit